MTETERQLALAVLGVAEDASMPDSYWQTDLRVRFALSVLWPGCLEWDYPPSRQWVRREALGR